MFKKRKHKASSIIKKKESNNSDDDEDLAATRLALGKITKLASKTKTKDEGKEEEIKINIQYNSTYNAMPHEYGGNATATTELNTEIDRDSRAILEKNIKLQGTFTEEDKGIYHGQAGYNNFIKKDIQQVGGNKYTGTQGPLRAPTFVRTTSRFDYQPDICKDYKETGYCGYGDSCKFLHDRGDYKSGWQLERDWDNAQAYKKRKLKEQLQKFGNEEGISFITTNKDNDNNNNDDTDYLNGDDRHDDIDVETADKRKKKNEDLPFACFKCRNDFKSPVITKCGHYLCGPCAVSLKNHKCPVCGKSTGGLYSSADHLLQELARKGMLENHDTSPTEVGYSNNNSNNSSNKIARGSWN